jgi:hypothetical protein
LPHFSGACQTRLEEFSKNRPFLHFLGGTLKSKALGSHGGVGWKLRRL